MSRQRLQRYLASCGLGSRRACEALIAAGRVSVNGDTVTRQGVSVDPNVDEVCLDARPVSTQRLVYVVLNKPPGIICSANDPDGRAVLADILPDLGVRLFSVGRLDRDSEGLLLLTNDGELANVLLHPRHHVQKVYRVWTDGRLRADQVAAMRAGIESEGERLSADGVREDGKRGRGYRYEVVLSEGRNRQVRRMFAACGLGVRRLQRSRFGPLRLTGLKNGQWRHLNSEELAALQNVAALEEGA